MKAVAAELPATGPTPGDPMRSPGVSAFRADRTDSIYRAQPRYSPARGGGPAKLVEGGVRKRHAAVFGPHPTNRIPAQAGIQSLERKGRSQPSWTPRLRGGTAQGYRNFARTAYPRFRPGYARATAHRFPTTCRPRYDPQPALSHRRTHAPDAPPHRPPKTRTSVNFVNFGRENGAGLSPDPAQRLVKYREAYPDARAKARFSFSCAAFLI